MVRVCVSVPVSALVVPPNHANHWPLCTAPPPPQLVVEQSGVPKFVDVCVQGVLAAPSSKLPSCTMKFDAGSVSGALTGLWFSPQFVDVTPRTGSELISAPLPIAATGTLIAQLPFATIEPPDSVSDVSQAVATTVPPHVLAM